MSNMIPITEAARITGVTYNTLYHAYLRKAISGKRGQTRKSLRISLQEAKIYTKSTRSQRTTRPKKWVTTRTLPPYYLLLGAIFTRAKHDLHSPSPSIAQDAHSFLESDNAWTLLELTGLNIPPRMRQAYIQEASQ